MRFDARGVVGKPDWLARTCGAEGLAGLKAQTGMSVSHAAAI